MRLGFVKISRIYYLLFILGFFFFPFNNFKGLSVLGEFRNEAGSYFFLAGFVIMLFDRKIIIPYKSRMFQIVMLIILWCFLSTLLNMSTVSSNYFKFTSGINRFVRQYISLIISSVIFFILFINSVKKLSTEDILKKIRKIFLYSLIFSSIYGTFEILVSVFNISSFLIVLETFDYFPFMNVNLHPEKIASITFEPPFLAIYLITISGWMFSYIATEKQLVKKFIPTILILFLTYFSGSRTALIIITIQFLVFISYLMKSEKNRQAFFRFFKISSIFLSILFLVNADKIADSISEKLQSLNFSDNLKNNISNQSRFGMQYAALQVFKQNPITGVGYGQQTYHSRFHYPKWAVKNNYEFELFYQNTREPSFPPAYNLYTRLLAEIGIIGILLLLLLFYQIFITIKKLQKDAAGDKMVILLQILKVSMIGFVINWLQFDSFRMYGFWLVLAILIKISQALKNNKNDEQYTAANTTF